MKSKKDKANEALSMFCGVLVVSMIVFVILLSTVINIAIDGVNKQADSESRHVTPTRIF